jgi:pyridoxal phosphate enzyme (YggS family)
MGVQLVVVSKTRDKSEILEAYWAGQRAFGENKVQELLSKQKILPIDIEWHLIGHLQTNKVRSVVPYVSVIHSIDSLKLLRIVNQEALLAGKVVRCLLQMHIAQEESKFGFTFDELTAALASPGFFEMKNVIIAGVMGMATFTDDTTRIRNEFRTLRNIFEELKDSFFSKDPNFTEISMGMSDDYQIAIEEESTIVRIGSKIFGPRIYTK